MEEKTDTKKENIKPKGDELILPILALVFAIYYLYTIKDLVWEAQINGLLIGSILILLVLAFFFRTGLEVIRHQASLKTGDLFRWNKYQAARIGLFGLAVVYVLAIPYAGFTLTTFVFLVTAMLVLGVRSPVKLITISLILSLTGYYLFIVLLDTRFPPGPVEHLFKQLF